MNYGKIHLIKLVLLTLVLHEPVGSDLSFTVPPVYAHAAPMRLPAGAEVRGLGEITRFMSYALEKMTGTKCITFVSDDYLGFIVGSLDACNVHLSFCNIYTYNVHFTGGNMSEAVMKTLKAGRLENCGGYVVLVRSTKSILKFLHQGDELQLINTRAKFLIWYSGHRRSFEKDSIWEKIPNVIFFYSRHKRRRKGLIFTIRQLKWPVVINSSESRVRVTEIWGANSKSNREPSQVWYYDKTTNLKNITLRVTVVDHPPGVFKYKNALGQVEYGGTEIQILKGLSQIMKFSYEFYDADPKEKWGGQISGNDTSKNGREFYGAVARLIYGESDLGIGSFFILKHYLNYIDMSIPIEVACTSFLIPNPLPRPRYLALILPFTTELWILVVVTSFIIGPLILYAFSSHPYYQKEHVVFRTKSNAILTSFRITLQVALHVWPKFWPIRLYFGWYWIFWFCITSGYRAAMVSFLTIPLYERPIDSIEDLAESTLGIGGWGTELQQIFLKHLEVNVDGSTEEILRSRYEVLKTLDEGISRVSLGNFALYENMRFLKFVRLTRNLSRVGSPTMRIMKQCIVPIHMGFAYQKNSALTPTVNRYLRLFQESGLTKRFAQRLVSLTRKHDRRSGGADPESVDEDIDDSNKESYSNKSRKQRVLRIQDLQGAVYLFTLGLGLASLIFGIELFYKKSNEISRELEMNILGKVINKSGAVIGAWDPPPKLLDPRVRKRRKRKRPKNPPPFPYVE